MPSVTIDTNVDIIASPDEVWDVLTDFSSYGEWCPSMRVEVTDGLWFLMVVMLPCAACGCRGLLEGSVRACSRRGCAGDGDS
jgi:hypothetical protein